MEEEEAEEEATARGATAALRGVGDGRRALRVFFRPRPRRKSGGGKSIIRPQPTAPAAVAPGAETSKNLSLPASDGSYPGKASSSLSSSSCSCSSPAKASSSSSEGGSELRIIRETAAPRSGA